MRSFDFAPLYRASIGFDQIADLLDRVSAHEGGQSSYPPYNIGKLEKMDIAFPLRLPDFQKRIWK